MLTEHIFLLGDNVLCAFSRPMPLPLLSSDDGALSPNGRETRKDDDFDSGTDESENRREKKWRRDKDKDKADLPQGGDKEVNPGA